MTHCGMQMTGTPGTLRFSCRLLQGMQTRAHIFIKDNLYLNVSKRQLYGELYGEPIQGTSAMLMAHCLQLACYIQHIEPVRMPLAVSALAKDEAWCAYSQIDL